MINIPDDCPNLVGIKMSLQNHREELYEELETQRVEPEYRDFVRALLSKAEEQFKKEAEESYLNNVDELGHQRKIKKSAQELNQHTSHVRPRSGADGSMQIQAARKIGNGRRKELLKKKPNTDVLRPNGRQALSSKKSNAESSRVSKAILVDIEDSSEPEHDRRMRLGKRVDPTGSGSRNVVDRRNVDKGKSVIQVEDPVHENTNQRLNPKNQIGRMDKAHDTRKLREAVKGKNVVRCYQMDKGRSSQKPGPGNNLSPKNLSEHVDKLKGQSEKGLKRPVASTYTVIENHHEHGDSAHRPREGEVESRKKMTKVVGEERASFFGIIASSSPPLARRQLGNNSQVPSSAEVINRRLRNIEFSESSRQKKKICKNNQRKEIADEAPSDMEKETESFFGIIASSTPPLARRQLGNNSQVPSSAEVINRQLRNVNFSERSKREKKFCKNNQRKEIADEAPSDMEKERESFFGIIASSTPPLARRQLGNNSQVPSSAEVINRQLRNVNFSERSRREKKFCKNNQRKEIASDAAFLEGNLGPLVPSEPYKEVAYEHNGRAHSEFRANLLNVLKRPFDQEEYHRLQEAVQNGLYLKTYPDLREVLVKNRYIKAKRLTILRGFFFWLQNLAQQEAFRPWIDRECLAVEQESG